MNPPAAVEELFISERRRPLCRVTGRVMIRQVAAAADLEHLELHPHMLRHSCGYVLVNKGVDVRVIQDFLGHSVNFLDGKVHQTQSLAVRETVLNHTHEEMRG